MSLTDAEAQAEVLDGFRDFAVTKIAELAQLIAFPEDRLKELLADEESLFEIALTMRNALALLPALGSVEFGNRLEKAVKAQRLSNVNALIDVLEKHRP